MVRLITVACFFVALFYVGPALSQPGCVGIGYSCASNPCCNPFQCHGGAHDCPGNAPCCTPNIKPSNSSVVKDVLLAAARCRQGCIEAPQCLVRAHGKCVCS